MTHPLDLRFTHVDALKDAVMYLHAGDNPRKSSLALLAGRAYDRYWRECVYHEQTGQNESSVLRYRELLIRALDDFVAVS
jgi:hypothetical protein